MSVTLSDLIGATACPAGCSCRGSEKRSFSDTAPDAYTSGDGLLTRRPDEQTALQRRTASYIDNITSDDYSQALALALETTS